MIKAFIVSGIVGAAVMVAPAGAANASCVAFNGRTSANGDCTADAGSVALVLGSASQAAAKGRGSVAVVVGNGSASYMTKGDGNVGIVFGQRSRATSQGGDGGNRFIVAGNDNAANNIDGSGNKVSIIGNRNIVGTFSNGAKVSVRGNDLGVSSPKP